MLRICKTFSHDKRRKEDTNAVTTVSENVRKMSGDADFTSYVYVASLRKNSL